MSDLEHIDSLITALPTNQEGGVERLVDGGSAALQRLLDVNDGTVQLDFGTAHSTDIADGITAALAEFAVRTPDPFFDAVATRPDDVSIAWALQSLVDHRSVEYLVVALGAAGWPPRWAAATGLGRLGDAAAVPALSAVLRDSESLVRSAAVQSLARLCDPRAVPALRSFVDNPPPGAVEKELEAATKAIETILRSGRLRIGDSPTDIAEQITRAYRTYGEQHTGWPEPGDRRAADLRFARDQDLVWAAGGPAVERGHLFQAGSGPWGALFDGRSPWLSTCLMFTQAGDPVVVLAVQSPVNRRHDSLFTEMAMTISYERRPLSIRP